MTLDKLAIIIPCFNEEESLRVNIKKLIDTINPLINEGLISNESFLYFVDDGSMDKTWEIITHAKEEYQGQIKAIQFTRNYGNQCAILAGLNTVTDYDVDCVITIDADLQQDESKIRDFILKYKEGNEIVFGIRNDRKTDGFIKKTTSLAFYKIMQLFGCNVIPNHSEYRLMSRRAIELFNKYPEKNIFIRGIFSNLGLKAASVYFDVKERKFGVSKFNFLGLARLASWGIVSFSVTPLRMIFYIGLITSSISFLFAIATVINYFIYGEYIIFANFSLYKIFEMFLSGVQILSIGIIGEYIGQILQEVKGRPNYHINKKMD